MRSLRYVQLIAHSLCIKQGVQNISFDSLWCQTKIKFNRQVLQTGIYLPVCKTHRQYIPRRHGPALTARVRVYRTDQEGPQTRKFGRPITGRWGRVIRVRSILVCAQDARLFNLNAPQVYKSRKKRAVIGQQSPVTQRTIQGSAASAHAPLQ